MGYLIYFTEELYRALIFLNLIYSTMVKIIFLNLT